MINEETEIQDAFETFWTTWAERKNGADTIHDLLPLFAHNVSTIGTGEHEIATNFSEVVKDFSDDLKELVVPLALDYLSFQVKLLSPNAGMVEAQANIVMETEGNIQLCFPVRLSTTFIKQEDQWLLIHNHISTPSQDQDHGEAFPLDALKAKNRRLEKLVTERTAELKKRTEQLRIEKHKTEELLYNILPREIAQELKEKGKTDAKNYDTVSVLFTDFKSFTQTSELLTAQELVSEINICFEAFDAICDKYHIEKIKTIGDSYMVAGGLPVPFSDSAINTVTAALDMIEFMEQRREVRESKGKIAFEMRIGIHSGPVVAGIVGIKKFQYDIWGDTVNTASRVESKGSAGRVNISESTYQLVKDHPAFRFEPRGLVDVKGKEPVGMYFVENQFSDGSPTWNNAPNVNTQHEKSTPK